MKMYFMTLAIAAFLLAPVMAEEVKTAPAVSAPAKTEMAAPAATPEKPAKKVVIKKAKSKMKKM